MGDWWPDRTGRDPGLHVTDVLVLLGSVAFVAGLIWWVMS